MRLPDELPTKEMIVAGCHALIEIGNSQQSGDGEFKTTGICVSHIVKAALAVAPTPPAQGYSISLTDCYTPAPPAQEIEEMSQRKDQAYAERNSVVAALARLFPSGTARTAIEGWSEDWHGCVYIDLPTGQVSWHFHDSQAHLFECLPAYTKPWDGHTTEEKYQRLAAMKSPAQEASGDLKIKIRDVIAKHLGDAYFCTRVWNAWNVGTMSQDDFSPLSENEDILLDAVDEVLSVIPPAQEAEPYAYAYEDTALTAEQFKIVGPSIRND